MGMWVGRGRKARRCYGFDEIALVPGRITINPNDVDVKWKLQNIEFEIPILAAAMDGAVDGRFAIEMGKLGGLAVLNLEGVQTRYDHPQEVIDKIINAEMKDSTRVIQEVYSRPVKEELIEKRIKEIKTAGVRAAVSSIPMKAERFGQIAQEAGADIFVVQSTVTTVRHYSTEYEIVDFYKLRKLIDIPLIIGNCVTYDTTLELMDTGADALLIGVGPGAACTTRGVLGIGVPQVTATADAAAARDFYFKKSGRYVPVITDGGMSGGGDICKAFASGADAVMVGSAFTRATEAPGKGFHWGMAMPHAALPRGTKIQTRVTGTLKQILFGPAELDDGSQNLVGALKTSMGNCGARDIREMQMTELIIAPAIKTEGKLLQQVQRVGMGK
jgi:IMP dehydrogenase